MKKIISAKLFAIFTAIATVFALLLTLPTFSPMRAFADEIEETPAITITETVLEDFSDSSVALTLSTNVAREYTETSPFWLETYEGKSGVLVSQSDGNYQNFAYCTSLSKQQLMNLEFDYLKISVYFARGGSFRIYNRNVSLKTVVGGAWVNIYMTKAQINSSDSFFTSAQEKSDFDGNGYETFCRTFADQERGAILFWFYGASDGEDGYVPTQVYIDKISVLTGLNGAEPSDLGSSTAVSEDETNVVFYGANNLEEENTSETPSNDVSDKINEFSENINNFANDNAGLFADWLNDKTGLTLSATSILIGLGCIFLIIKLLKKRR